MLKLSWGSERLHTDPSMKTEQACPGFDNSECLHVRAGILRMDTSSIPVYCYGNLQNKGLMWAMLANNDNSRLWTLSVREGQSDHGAQGHPKCCERGVPAQHLPKYIPTFNVASAG